MLKFECRALDSAGVGEGLGDLLPVHHFPPGREVIWATVLVLQVVRVLPNITAQDRCSAACDTRHEWVVLIGGGADVQFAVGQAQP